MARWFSPKERIRSFDNDSKGYRHLARRYVGSQTISVDSIVGSVGRARELRSDFLPRRKSLGFPRGSERYRRIRRMMAGLESVRVEDLLGISGCRYDHDVRGRSSLPPIEVYRLEHRYYVVDGHHRVAAALSLGQLEIDAVVIEIYPVDSAVATGLSAAPAL